jgi:hypothetical protein
MRTQVSEYQEKQYLKEMIRGKTGILDYGLNTPEKGEVADLRKAPQFPFCGPGRGTDGPKRDC